MKDMQTKAPDRAKIAQSFRRSLGSYSDAASVQAEIASALAGDLSAALAATASSPVFDRALEFGCGTGHLTRALTQEFQFGALTLNDLIPNYVPVSAPPGAHTLSGAIESIHLSGPFDLIASASTIQWISDISALLNKLTDSLAPGGWLALSGFGPRQFTELRALGSQAAAPSYTDPTSLLAMLPASLEVHAINHRPVTLEFDTAIALLRHLRDTGVNGAARSHWTRADLANFEARYREAFAPTGPLPLTYDPVRLIARKRA